ncbi:MAG: ACT domain-containing protein, partial [Nostoc sp.]
SNPKLDEAEVMIEHNIAKVSIAGAGMIGRPGVAAKMFATLAAAGVNIQMISTSEVKVSCVVDAAECDRAVAALRTAFEIEAGSRGELLTPNSSSLTPNSSLLTPHSSPIPPVRGVALDLNQARLAIRQLPDR